jgi:4-amino-4-deoxy-L-arabinose transferase-like glycosyltransferase
MIDTGEWGLLYLYDGRPDLQKPPGYYWAVAVLGQLNGGKVNELVTRLPATLSGFLCSVLVFLFLRQMGRPVAAVVALFALATANHFIGISRTARIDVPLTLSVLVSLVAFYRGCLVAANQNASRLTPLLWHLLAAVAAGTSVLLKGPVGPALIGPAAFLWFFLERFRQSPDAKPRIPLASWVLIPSVVAAIGLPWFVWANLETNGELYRVFFLHHVVDRFNGNSPRWEANPNPWWYYVPRFIVDFMPWTPLLNFLAGWMFRTGRWRTDPAFRFAIIAFFTGLVVLSAAQFKRSDYLLPIYPFAAIALGCAAENWFRSRSEARSVLIGKWVFRAVIGVAIACWISLLFVVEPLEQERETKRRFAAFIRAHAPAPNMVLQFRMESHLLTYHLGRPVYTFMEWGELNEILAQPGPHYVVMQAEYVRPAMEIVTSRKLVEVARGDDFAVGRSVRPLVFLRTVD